MTKRSLTFVAACVALLAVGVWGAHHIAFDWRTLREQLRSVSMAHVALGIAAIYSGYILRAMRWSLLMEPHADRRAVALIAPQFIGFTAVALFGRLADLTRPYVIARRSGLSVASQVAVYSVERIFDLASAAILFSVTLAFAPRGMPHHEAFARAGVVSLAATAFLVSFALAVRLAGSRLAALAERKLHPLSPVFATKLAARILEFRQGLNTVRSGAQMAGCLGLSLLLWLGIAEAYVQSAHAFAATPQLAGLTFTQTMLLMATSLGGSLLQLPVVGWFTQIGLLAAALHEFYAVPAEAATACGFVTLFVTTLAIIPVGLAAARLSGTGLRVRPDDGGPEAKH